MCILYANCMLRPAEFTTLYMHFAKKVERTYTWVIQFIKSVVKIFPTIRNSSMFSFVIIFNNIRMVQIYFYQLQEVRLTRVNNIEGLFKSSLYYVFTIESLIVSGKSISVQM